MPIRSFLCSDCLYEFDEIRTHDASSTVDCPRCEAKNSSHTIPTAPSTPRGNFATAARRPKDKPQIFKFNSDGQGELFDKKDDN